MIPDKYQLKFRILLSAYCLVLSASIATKLSAEELRDPFAFGHRQAVVQPLRATLMGVLWDATHPLAIVGEDTVAIGDIIADWQVVQIQEDGIIIEREGRRVFVGIGKALPQD